MNTAEKIVLAAIAFAVGAVFSSSASASSNTWWVDDANYGAAGRDGSETNPFGSIHEALANEECAAGDTIKVKPGVYNKDFDERTVKMGNSNYQMRTRVYINKKVNIVAVGSKEETHIVGRFCPVSEGGNATYYSGPTAVRCVYVTANGQGSTLTGFTLRESATPTYADADYSYNCGGAVSVADSAKDFYVTDCVISNCTTRYWGGAAYGGTFNRCLISDCRGYTRGAAFYKSYAINCVIAHCRLIYSDEGKYVTLSYSADDKLVNCTFYGNEDARVLTANCYNCLFVGNGSDETNGTVIASNIYATQGKKYANANPFQLFAPALGDFRPLPDSAALGAGDPSKLSIVELPAGTELRDMDGNLIDTASGTIAAGAYQLPKAPTYGGIMLTGNATVESFSTYGSNLFYVASWPVSVKVVLPDSVFRLAVHGTKPEDIHSRYAGTDGYVCITPPYAAGAVQTNESVAAKYTRYVDGVNGNDDNDGKSWAKAWKTLQNQINVASDGSPRLAYVAEGDYCTGGGVERGVTNRVNCPSLKFVKFVAVGERDKTIIRGAAAKNERDPQKHPGCGPDAVRCVSTSNTTGGYDQGLAFVGFTLADGHTDVGQDADDDIGGAGFGRAKRPDSLQFIDCVFTNCYAPAGGLAKLAHFTRCRFIDCGGSSDGFRDSVLSSSVVEKGRFGTGVFGAGTRAVGCSVADSNALESGKTGQIVLNCALGNGGTLTESAVTWGSTASSRFASVRNGDLRIRATSPALDATQRAYPSPGDDAWNNFTKYFSYYATDSIDAKPWVYSGAYPIAGAYMEWLDPVGFMMIVR